MTGMKRFYFIVLGLWLPAVLAFSAEPCLMADQHCREWINFPGGGRSLVYRTYSLTEKNEAVTRALIVVHGAGRDADNYFRTTLAAAFLAGALNNTVLVAPRFASNNGRSCHDTLDSKEVNWSCNGDSWRSGGDSETRKGWTSFDFMDELLKQVADQRQFPNLKTIVLTGHSAGGQFVTRYQMLSQENDKLAVPIRYIVSNPSSYAYPVPERPVAEGGFKPFSDSRNCTTYDNWPYGLQKRTGYSARLSEEQVIEHLAKRPVTYLLGEIDILPLGGFDSSCPAMAQGTTRLARGQTYQKLVADKFKVEQKVVVVPLCGHNARCMYTSEMALPLLFPKE